jgi:hypothetical protein
LVFNDENRNLVADPGEALAGVTVCIARVITAGCMIIQGSDVSDANGQYQLSFDDQDAPCTVEIELSGFDEDKCEPIGPLTVNSTGNGDVTADFGIECSECATTHDCIDKYNGKFYYKCKDGNCVCLMPVPFRWLCEK